MRALGLILVLLSGCRLAGAPVAAPTAPSPSIEGGPALIAGSSTPADEAEVARLLADGASRLAQSQFAEALERANEVELRFPTTDGSASALMLRARAAQGLGDFSAADAAIDRYLPLVSEDRERLAEATLLRAEVRWVGELGGGIEALFEVSAEADTEVLEEAELFASDWAITLQTSELRDLVEEAPPHPRILPVFLVELATRRHLAGAEGEARELAEAALEFDLGPETADRARSVLDGRIDAESAVAAVIGAVLPSVGPPSVLELAREIRDGIETALAVDEGSGRLPVRLVTADASTGGVAAALASLEGEGVTGVIGPIDEASLQTVASGRIGGFPVLSPTARMVPDGAEGLFSLTGVDPEAGRALASLVRGQGIGQVVLMHPASAESFAEARWFREAFQAAGGTVTRTLTYPVAVTSFADLLSEIVRMRPRGLVLLLPQGDIEMLAPQLGFYGVDGIPGLTIFGNESWVTQPVLGGVPTRHTNGVLAVTSSVSDGEFGPGWNQFVMAYEEHFRRTLRSPVPALGYDAARLLLQAARVGGGSPEGTLRAFNEIRDFPGATGVLSVIDGRIRRSYTPVRIENGRAFPLTP